MEPGIKLPVTPSRPRSATIRDVARLAGVSHQTVSRVINDLPGISAATRDRVRMSMTQLNYRPSRTATALARRRTNTVGIICTDGGRFGAPKALRTIERAARDAGYFVSTVNLTSIDATSMKEALNHLDKQQVEGLVVIAPQASMIDYVFATAPVVPVVVVEASGRATDHSVAIDNRLGAALATAHLISLGHERIAHVSGPTDWFDAQARIAGWRTTLQEAGLPPGRLVAGDWSPVSGSNAAGEVLASDATAVFCANDAMALGLIHMAKRLGRSIPSDLSVVGFDDLPEAAFFDPPLSTVTPDYSEVGRRCMQTLLSLMAGGSPPQMPFVEPVFTTRDSCAAPTTRSDRSSLR